MSILRTEAALSLLYLSNTQYAGDSEALVESRRQVRPVRTMSREKCKLVTTDRYDDLQRVCMSNNWTISMAEITVE